MMKLVCGENNLEYTGGGFIQCGRHVKCPKHQNNKVLGFDCILYMDNLPEGCRIDNSEQIGDMMSLDVVSTSGGNGNGNGEQHICSHRNGPAIRIIPADEQVIA